jgi:hypothetical protein
MRMRLPEKISYFDVSVTSFAKISGNLLRLSGVTKYLYLAASAVAGSYFAQRLEVLGRRFAKVTIHIATPNRRGVPLPCNYSLRFYAALDRISAMAYLGLTHGTVLLPASFSSTLFARSSHWRAIKRKCSLAAFDSEASAAFRAFPTCAR